MGGCFDICVVMIGASTCVVSLIRGERLLAGGASSGRMMAGTVPGVLLRVVRRWVRGATLCVAGAVGLAEVVIWGASLTL